MAPTRTDFYECLGIVQNATQEQIRKAYRRKALDTHPDRLPQDATEDDRKRAAELFRLVNNAYEVLSNETTRERYDRHGMWPPPQDQPHNEHEDQDFDGFFPEFDPFQRPGFYTNVPHSHRSRRPHRGHTFSFSPDPMWSSFNRRSDPFGFTDPFELFDRVFQQMDEMVHQHTSHMHRSHHHHQSSLPPSPFDSSFFGSPFGFAWNHNFTRQPSLPPIGSGQSFHTSSSSFALGGPNDAKRNFVSTEFRTQTVNGITHTIKRRIDSDGNEYVTQTFPNGHKTRFLNGVEQPRGAPPPIAKDHSDEHLGNQVVAQSEKKKWWRGW